MGSNSSHNNNNPLFSCIVTLYILIFLYFPKLIISPTLISTLILLLFILRLGTSQQTQQQQKTFSELELETVPLTKLNPTIVTKPYCTDTFIEWQMWGPLEVIHEAYEGEDGDEETQKDALMYDHGIKSRYYPESGSSSGSCSSSCSSSCSLDGEFEEMERWREEVEKEDMFEIVLDYGFGYKNSNVVKKLKNEVNIVDEEDNLIEIDISPSKKECEFSW